MAVTTDYLSGFEYEDGMLQTFPHAEGYVERKDVNVGNGFNIMKYVYHYIYKDHLGNNRLIYADLDGDGTINPATEIVEENNYYPFGLKHKGYNELPGKGYKYKYAGKELNDELGLDLYDFGARNYDPALGRWLNVDPLAENSRRWTPYNYAYNNPIFFVDPDGMQSWSFSGQAAQDLFRMLVRDLDGPGDEFKTADAAFEDFGKEYNGLSIRLNTELRSNIYSYKKDGTTYFTYDRPHGMYIRGEDGKNKNSGVGIRFGGVDAKEDYVPKNGTRVADAHTHSAYEKATDDSFSELQDIGLYVEQNVNGYVSTPGGLGLKYDVKTGVINKLFDSFAYDKKHPTIKKNYNADKNPTVYPLIGVYKDKGREPWEGYMTEEEMKIK